MTTKVYIMLDNETTGLDPSSALAWEVGMVMFSADYKQLSASTHIAGVDPALWEPGTLQFAKDTYGALVVRLATAHAAGKYDEAMREARKYIQGAVDLYGYTNVFIICNHVEFDWPILMNSFAIAHQVPAVGKPLIHHRNKLDMQSLCIGKAGKGYSVKYEEYKKLSSPVAHRAVADCHSQIAMLQHFGVELPA